jgi:hypothetical protein
MKEKLEAKVLSAPCFGRDGLVGNTTHLHLEFACGLPDPQDTGPHFPAWEYRPAYLSDPLLMYVGEVGIEEPMWVCLSFMRRAQREQWFIEQPIGVREITGLTLTTPVPLRSAVAQTVVESGILSTRTGTTSLLEIEFDGNRRKKRADFRPHLPFVFQL